MAKHDFPMILALAGEGGGGGSSDYGDLTNKPKINGVELSGQLTSADLKLQDEIPVITVTSEMIIEQDPIKIQGNAEINAIMTNTQIPFVILDASSVGLGSTVFHKAKMRTEHYWLLTQTAGNFNSDTQQITEKTIQSVIYNDTTMIAVYEESELQDKLIAGTGFSITHNTINYDPDVLPTVDYVDMSISDTLLYVDQQDASEHAGRVAGDNLINARIDGVEEAKQDREDNNLVTRDKNIIRAINETNSIAKGANQAVGFENYLALITELNSAAADKYKAGQNFYVKTLNVPDLWIMSVEVASVSYTYTTDKAFITATEAVGGCQVGYYKLAQLETQKVDLTNYVKDTDYATQTKCGVIKVETGYGSEIASTGGLRGSERTYSQYSASDVRLIISKGTLENVFTGKNIKSTITLTQAEYDALTEYADNTNYQIIEE